MNNETIDNESLNVTNASINKNNQKSKGGRGLTHDEFIKRVSIKHEFIEVVGKYSGALSVVHCKCSVCGFEWDPFPESLYKGKGCPKCFNRSRNGSEKFFQKMLTAHPTISICGTYENQLSRLKCKCSVCGCEWESTPNTLLKGKGCIKCSGNYHRTQEEFINDLSKTNPTVEIIGHYTNTQVVVACKCRNCGHLWSASPSHLLRGRACPECAKTKIGNALRKPHGLFIDEMMDLHPTIEIKGVYKSRNERVQCICKVCKNEWTPLASNLYNGNGCPKCGIKQRALSQSKTHEQFLNEMTSINPHIQILGKYLNQKSRIECKCINCEHVWTAKADNLLTGRGCPYCAHSQTSFFERFLLLVFKKFLGEDNVLSRDRLTIGKELDIYLPSLKIAIEPGSYFWHKSKINDDKEKHFLCKQRGIRLITIYDKFDGNINDLSFPDDDLITYNKPLKTEEDFAIALDHILNKLQFNYSLCAEDKHLIYIDARKSINKVTTQTIINRLSEINPNIELLGQYEGDKVKIPCRCKKCGHEWERTAYNLVNQQKGCPLCNGNQKRVIDLDTGDVFDSVVEASKHFGVTPSSLGCSCRRRNGVCKKHRVAYINNLSNEQIDALLKNYPDKLNKRILMI